MEKERVNHSLEINIDRRQHRAQRPQAELVHDGAFKQLDNETTLLQDIVSKLDICLEEVSERNERELRGRKSSKRESSENESSERESSERERAQREIESSEREIELRER